MHHNPSLSNNPNHAIIIPDICHPLNPPLRQSMRTYYPSSHLSYYHCYSTYSTSPPSKVLNPLSYIISYSQCSAAYQTFVVLSLPILNLPLSIKPTSLIVGSMLWMLNCRLLQIIIFGLYLTYLLVRFILDVDRSIRSNIRQMVQLKGIKLGLL